MRRVLIPYGNGRAVVSPLYHGFFDDIFNDTFKGSPMNVILRSNIKETETSYVVEAELAGYNKDDISLYNIFCVISSIKMKFGGPFDETKVYYHYREYRNERCDR